MLLLRFLVVGAGAVGGYFGGRLMENGQDVTFLVRPHRQKQLAKSGLVIHSSHGDFRSPVQTLTPGQQGGPFDVVLLAVKAYHLEQAIQDLIPYMGDDTVILPLLNGMVHLDRLEEAFSPGQVLGGLCLIEATLNGAGEVKHFGERHHLFFGERDGSESVRVRRVEQAMEGARFEGIKSGEILRRMWEKYLFLATFSGVTSLMNSSIGPILETGEGSSLTRRLLDEIACAARHREPSLDDALVKKVYEMIRFLEPSMKSSMLRDMEKGAPVEGEHLQGVLLRMAGKEADLPLLSTVYNRLQIYEANRQQEVTHS
ncbi:ketopantoate reductase family protein [Kroppenstedtia eburnea]|uniref:ketopantoate reductase family protein n=1 Tax=Kroppenstedtia eburnea TaxID=714067 RepID=UPI001F47AF07|nr:ketopantoate reductase family protein [Kroppenstedtia eburnea]